MRWSVVVPVKVLTLAKTRLAGPGRPAAWRAELALALARDTVEAAERAKMVGRVVVVTNDPVAAEELGGLAMVVPDEPDAGLNPALDHGASRAVALAPADGVVALAADLGALRPTELDAALVEADGYERSFVPDAAGTGSTMLAARPGTGLEPRFGPGSREAHRASDAVELDGVGPSLRQDVDTVEGLERAARLGLGPATRAFLDLSGRTRRSARL